MLPTDKDILLVADSRSKALLGKLWANRVGMDRIIGYLNGGIVAWLSAGMSTTKIQQISANDLHQLTTGNEEFVLLDVRAPGEYTDKHIKGAINIPVADLRTRYTELDKNKKIILICSSGNRSSLGSSILESHGFTNLYNTTGGYSGYSAAGYSEECQVCANPHGPKVKP